MNKPIQDFIDTIENKSTQELKTILFNLSSDISDLKGKIDFAKSQREIGEESDPVRYAKLKYALRKQGLKHQIILKELSDRKIKQQKSVEHYFVTIAKERLNSDLFYDIMDEAINKVEES